MKSIILGLSLLTGVAHATDFGSYCLSFLNGELSEKPEMVKDFKFKEETVMIKGQKQKTIAVDYIGIGGNVSDMDTKFDPKSKTETQSIVISTKNAKGKDVKDYTLMIKRNENGDIVQIKKKFAALDFRPIGDKIDFETKNGICIPNEKKSGIKRDFNASLCHEVEDFFAANPESKVCVEKNLDMKLADIISKYHKGYKMMKPRTAWGSLLAGKALGECFENGLSEMVVDQKVWGSSSGSSQTTSTPSEETGEDE